MPKKNRSQFRLPNHLPVFTEAQFGIELLEAVVLKNVMLEKVHAENVSSVKCDWIGDLRTGAS